MANRHRTARIFTVGSRHPRTVAFVRIGIGLYLLALTVVLVAGGVSGPWAWVTGVCAIIHFILAWRRLRFAGQRPCHA